MSLSELTDRNAVLAAIHEYDTLGPDIFLSKYGYSPARHYRLVHEGKSYDSKAIVGVAFKHQFPDRGPLQPSEFSGGESTVVPLLEKLGFEVQINKPSEQEGVTSTPANPSEDRIQKGFEKILATYPSIRSSVAFGEHDDLKNELNQIRSAIEALPAVRAHPQVQVSWSLGLGHFARVPWIALMDQRETTSTQRGIYGVFLFPEDMSGVYLTLNQGVTDITNEHGRPEGRKILRERARTIRSNVSANLSSFSLDDGIRLSTAGGQLALDYEASTIAYRYYAKGQIPNDKVLDEDLGRLLAAYATALEQRSTIATDTPQWWIFQANPKIYDVDAALRELSDLTWTVKHEASRAAVGDRVFVWRSGREAGVVAIATITEPAAPRECATDELPFVLDVERLGGIQPRVMLHIDRHLKNSLLRGTIAAEARLKDLMILRFANYGTFKVAPHHAAALLDMIEDQDVPRVLNPEKDHRVWIYAPGETAEYWDEFYEDEIMAIGWDSLGDLRQYGSIDDYAAALQSKDQSDKYPTNNAKACFDFAHSLHVGDRIFVKRGVKTLIGYGTVTGEYVFDSARPYFKNTRKMRWEGRGSWVAPEKLPIKTLTEITGAEEFVETIDTLVLGASDKPPQPVPAVVREPYTIDQALDGVFMDADVFARALSIWRQKKNLVLQGPPGVGKSFIAKRLAYALMGYRDPSRVRTVQFHQSYSYEDFVQGYRPSKAGLTLQQGVFVEFCEKARTDSEEKYVFIIDEINRGNLSKILGELMLLIEPDKRSSDWATKLAYALAVEERFYVPPNMFLLGMMNTADRSLSLVDYALRRRFAFVTLPPQYRSSKFRQHLTDKGVSADLINRVIERMNALNEDIEGDKTNLGPGFCVGHSFFVPTAGGENLDLEWYRRIIDTEVAPLLEEYWFDNPAKAKEWRDRLLKE